MAKDVDLALHQVIERAGGRTPDQAAAYVQALRREALRAGCLLTWSRPKKSSLAARRPPCRTTAARHSGRPFFDRHDRGASPASSAFIAIFIPLTTPRPGEQYAFEVALDSCTGCKACVSACHSLNGLDDRRDLRDTGLVLGGDDYRPPLHADRDHRLPSLAEPPASRLPGARV